MADYLKQSVEPLRIESPEYWDEAAFYENWSNFLQTSLGDRSHPVPLKRLRLQIENSHLYLESARNWQNMDGTSRLRAWKGLLEAFEETLKEPIPACLECGECCRRSSPTLHTEDLELLQKGAIPWNCLVTLRIGEPVYSPILEKPFLLESECIKLIEKPGTTECYFLDGSSDRCGIYKDRPVQCRAQACWDPRSAKLLAKQPHLLRKDIFGDAELLMEIISEHDRRFDFRKLEDLFTKLHETRGSNIDEVLEFLAYEEHFREFFSDQLKIPKDTMGLVFGRTFADLVPLFGFRVLYEDDGSRCLTPETS